MERVNVKNLSKYLFLSSFVGVGTTAICFRMLNGKLLKIYRNTELKRELFYDGTLVSALESLEVIENDSYVIPEKLIFKDDELCGYITPFVDGVIVKKLSYLTKVKTIASSYPELIEATKIVSSYGFELKDLHERNIMYDGSIKIIDLDRTVKRSDLEIKKLTERNMLNISEVIIKSLFKVNSDIDLVFYDKKLFDLYKSAIFYEYETYQVFYNKLMEMYGEDVNIRKLKSESSSLLYKVDRTKLGYR